MAKDMLNDADYFIEKSKDNKNILRVKKDGKFIYIGSKYSVQRDIDNFRKEIKELNKETIIIVFGLGTGEHILELLNYTCAGNKILVIEPDENIINIFDKLPYKNRIKSQNRINIWSYKEEELNDIIDTYINMFNMNNVEILNFANYRKLYSEQFKNLMSILSKKMNDYILDLNTSIVFSDEYFRCFINNIPKIIKSTCINNFKNKFADKPAIVVSAGPSLQKNIHLLKEAKDKFVIIVGGRTLKSCLSIGVTPDFVCVIDPGEPSYEVIKNSLDSEVPLVFNELTNNKVVEEHKGEKIFFTDIYLNGITNNIINMEIDTLYQGGSVAHICTSFAEYIGCNPVIFIGQDLAYTNNKYHAEAATTDIDRRLDLVDYKGEKPAEDRGKEVKELFGEKAENNTFIKSNDLFTEDIYGDRVLTSRVFLFYKELLERFIKENSKTTFINSSEGGANIVGTEVKKLQQVIEQHNKIIDKDITDILLNSKKANTSKVKKFFEEVVEKLSILREKSGFAIEYADKMLQNYSGIKKHNVNQINKEINKIDNFFNENMEKVNVLRMLLMPQITKIIMDFKYIGKVDETEIEMGERLAEKTKALYSEIIKVIDKSLPELKKLIETLARDS